MKNSGFYYDCYLANINDACNMMGQKKTHYLFANYFVFDYRPEENDGKKIQTYIRTSDRRLNTSYKISIKDHEVVGLDEHYIQEIVDEELSKKHPVMVWTTTYNCHWTKFYQKEYIIHAFLIREKYENNMYLCDDPFFGIIGFSLKSDYIFSIVSNIDVFKIQYEPMTKKDIINLLYPYYEKYQKKNIYKSYILFYNDIFCKKISKTEIVDFYSFYPLRKMKELSRFRMGYALFLGELENDLNVELREEISILKNSSDIFNILALALLKKILKDNIYPENKEYVFCRILELISNDKKILKGIRSEILNEN